MYSPGDHFHDRKAFTLVELMIVVVIFGLMILVSIPSFGRFRSSWQLTAETDKFATSLRTARSAAVLKNINAVFEFDTNNHTYSYFEDEDRDGVKDAGEYRSALSTLPTGLEIDSFTTPTASVVFGPKGNCLAGGTISIKKGATETRVVTVFAGTGNVTIN